MTAVGIDFGTTNSVVARANSRAQTEVLPIDTPPADWAEMGGFDRVLPTVMALDSGNRPEFGWAAKSSAHRLEAVKRLFKQEESAEVGGQVFVVEEIATMLFAHMKK